MERLRLDLQKEKGDDSKHMQELLAAKAREKALEDAKAMLEKALEELRAKYDRDMKERDQKCAELNAKNRDLVSRLSIAENGADSAGDDAAEMWKHKFNSAEE